MASNTFSLKIISANRVFFTGRCQSVIVPGYDGQKEVLAHHENMVIAVNEGEMRFLPEGEEEWQYAVVGIGFIEIVNNRVTLLVESVERPEEIDIARAQDANQKHCSEQQSPSYRSNLDNARRSGRYPPSQGIHHRIQKIHFHSSAQPCTSKAVFE